MRNKNLLLVVVSVLAVISLTAQSGWYWGRSSEGQPAANRTYAVCTDSFGGNYATGVFYGSDISFGNLIVYNPLVSSGETFLVKYNRNGSELWTIDVDSDGHNSSWSVCTDLSGNVIVCGTFTGTYITFGSVTLYKTSTPAPMISADMYVVKLDSSGNVLWARSAGGTYTEEACAVACDLNGNIFVGGEFDSDSVQFGSFVLSNTNVWFRDIFLVKYDAQGNVVWAEQAGGLDHDRIRGLCCDGSNIYACGAYESVTATFSAITLNKTGTSDGFIVKYDNNGNLFWANSITGATAEACRDIDVDESGDIYTVGTFLSSSLTIGSVTLFNGSGQWGGFDIFFMKSDANGVPVWARRIGRTNGDYVYSVAVEKEKSIYVSGAHYSDTIVAGNEVVYMTPGNNNFLFVAKYDESGNAQCLSALESDYMGNNGDVYISVDTAGDVFVGGQFANETMVVGPDTLTAVNSVDLFAAKFRCEWVFSSIAEEHATNELIISPNPSSGIFTISTAVVPERISVINSLGQIIITTKDCANKTLLDLSDCSSGIYVVIAEYSNSVQSQKVAVE